MKRKIMLKVVYDGTNYQGYQRQKNQITIQEVLEKAIDRIHNEHIKTHAASRTDSGVHSNCQIVDFETTMDLPGNFFKRAINTFLPDDIKVVESREVDHSFHSRYSALEKEYHYFISKSYQVKNHLYSYHVKDDLDVNKMVEAASKLVGKHDFKSFTSGTVYLNYVRELKEIKIIENDEQIIIIVKGKGFLRYMVRIIVGTLIEVGRGKINNIEEILNAKNRDLAGKTAPAKGLFLENISY